MPWTIPASIIRAWFADHWWFQGNEFLAKYVPNGGVPNYTYNTIDTSGVTDPAPQAVYATHRHSSAPGVTLSYSIPGVPSVAQNVRFHFASFYSHQGDEVFDIKINGTVRYPNYDTLGVTYGINFKATTQTFSVTPGGDGLITIDLVPKSSVYWTASVNGIEVLKP